MVRLPTERITQQPPYRLVLPARISGPQSRRAICDALCGLQLERRAFIEGDCVVIVRDRPPQIIAGATSWKVNALNDLKLITPGRVFFFPKSRWSYLLAANDGVLRSGPDPQLLLVASARRAR
jgi:hypothetical protein